MTSPDEAGQPTYRPYEPSTQPAPSLQQIHQESSGRQGPRVVTGSLAVLAVGLLIGAVVLAIGYFTVISVFDVPWYVAVPLSLVAGAGVLLYEMTFSWKAWLLAAVLVGLAALAAFGWWIG